MAANKLHIDTKPPIPPLPILKDKYGKWDDEIRGQLLDHLYSFAKLDLSDAFCFFEKKQSVQFGSYNFVVALHDDASLALKLFVPFQKLLGGAISRFLIATCMLLTSDLKLPPGSVAVPVLASNQGGLPWVVSDAGLIFEDYNLEDLNPFLINLEMIAL